MKLIQIRVNCRGCNTGHSLETKYPGLFTKSVAPFKCTRCGSSLIAEIKAPIFNRKKIEIRVKMIKHTQTLLNILNRRKISAKNHAKG